MCSKPRSLDHGGASVRRWARIGVALYLTCVPWSVAAHGPVEPGSNADRGALSLQELNRRAESVVVAQVRGTRSYWSGKIIVTDAKVEVLDVLRGKSTAGEVTVSFLGGTVGPIEQVVSGQPQLMEGEVAVLFLTGVPKNATVDPSNLMVAGAGGKLALLEPDAPKERLRLDRRVQRRIEAIRNTIQEGK